MTGGASNITLYKITIRNSPLFHISTTGNASNFTAWDVKISTPTTSRNTDGIDPGNATNFTITRSWISDGDDDVAVGASGQVPQPGQQSPNQAANISVTNNHLFAGHGQSIGSITEAGVSNILFDGNMAAGNGYADFGAAGAFSGNQNDSNSTGIRIKSADDRGGLVTNIQYSNECLLDHATDIQFTPEYDTTAGSDDAQLHKHPDAEPGVHERRYYSEHRHFGIHRGRQSTSAGHADRHQSAQRDA